MGENISGSCYCGEVQFEFEGKPGFRAQCFCRSCQYFAAGGPHTFLMVPKASFTRNKGKTTRFSTEADSGNTVIKEFCSTCGTPLFSHVEMFPDSVAINMGALEDPSRFPPKSSNWTRSAPAWAQFNPDLKQIY